MRAHGDAAVTGPDSEARAAAVQVAANQVFSHPPHQLEFLADQHVLALPLDHPRPRIQTFRGAAPRVEIPLPLCEALRSLGRREGATLFMTMLAGFVALLSRYTGQEDICVGSGIANRRRHETEALTGMIINNVVLRTNLEGDPTVRELIGRVRAVDIERRTVEVGDEVYRMPEEVSGLAALRRGDVVEIAYVRKGGRIVVTAIRLMGRSGR